MNKELTNQKKIEIFENTIKEIDKEIESLQLTKWSLNSHVSVLKLNKNIEDLLKDE